MEVGVAGERSGAEPGALQLPQAGQAGEEEERNEPDSQRSALASCVLHLCGTLASWNTWHWEGDRGRDEGDDRCSALGRVLGCS